MAFSSLNVGNPAPDFHLQDQDGNWIQLSAFKNQSPVVLVFYPGDMTPGCTIQLCALRDDWPKFESLGIKVFGINHGSDASHQTFRKKHGFPFPLLIDPDKKVSGLYGARWNLFGAAIIRRSVIGIDRQGVIRYIRRGLPRTSEILKAMKHTHL